MYEEQIARFLNPASLHFLFKELCLRLSEGWKLSETTQKCLSGDRCQSFFLSPMADRSICIFLSQYLISNPSAFLQYFTESPEQYHVLYIWLRAFGVSQPLQAVFTQQMRNILEDTVSIDPIEKTIHITNLCLQTIAHVIRIPHSNKLFTRFADLVNNLETHLGTIGMSQLMQNTYRKPIKYK